MCREGLGDGGAKKQHGVLCIQLEHVRYRIGEKDWVEELGNDRGIPVGGKRTNDVVQRSAWVHACTWRHR